MSSLALEVDRTLQHLDAETAARLERLVRDALALVQPPTATAAPHGQREAWLQRLDQLRASVGTGKTGATTEEILEDLRSERGG